MTKDDKERTAPEMPAAGSGPGGDLAGAYRLLYMVSMGLSIFLAAFGVIKFIDQLALLRQGEADTAQALVTGLGYLVGGGLSGAFVLLSVLAGVMSYLSRPPDEVVAGMSGPED